MNQEQADKKYTELATRLGDMYYQRKNAVLTVQMLESQIKKIEGEVDVLIGSLKAEKESAKVVEMKPSDT